MGTPASVASDPPGRAAPAARGRKRASANIFQGVGLPELRSLFQSGGAESPEERARLVWRYAGQRRMARVLRQLRRRRAERRKSSSHHSLSPAAPHPLRKDPRCTSKAGAVLAGPMLAAQQPETLLSTGAKAKQEQLQ
uniref:Arginine vasopressin-induced protein 1 n=1 Tax=Phasianus colchicus TaxID=9054 RepID=A0A669Q0L1_PHACC